MEAKEAHSSNNFLSQFFPAMGLILLTCPSLQVPVCARGEAGLSPSSRFLYVNKIPKQQQHRNGKKSKAKIK